MELAEEAKVSGAAKEDLLSECKELKQRLAKAEDEAKSLQQQLNFNKSVSRCRHTPPPVPYSISPASPLPLPGSMSTVPAAGPRVLCGGAARCL